jgi:hypothetical protein
VSEEVLLAVVSENTATAILYRAGKNFILETIVWPAVWDTRGRFCRDLTPDEARAWAAGHGVEIESEGPNENDL